MEPAQPGTSSSSSSAAAAFVSLSEVYNTAEDG